MDWDFTQDVRDTFDSSAGLEDSTHISTSHRASVKNAGATIAFVAPEDSADTTSDDPYLAELINGPQG